GGGVSYVLDASGSTGQPEGVVVEHRGLRNYVGHVVREYLGEGIEGGVVSTPLGFDATVTTLLGPLAAGKRVELLEEGEGVLRRLRERMFGEGEGGEGGEGGGGGEGRGGVGRGGGGADRASDRERAVVCSGRRGRAAAGEQCRGAVYRGSGSGAWVCRRRREDRGGICERWAERGGREAVV